MPATRTTRALAGAFNDRLVLVGCIAVAGAFLLGALAGGLESESLPHHREVLTEAIRL